MIKTIAIFVSTKTQILDIDTIPLRTRSQAKFVLIINKALEKDIERNIFLYDKVIYVETQKYKYLTYHMRSEIEQAFAFLIKNYNDLYVFVPDERNIGLIEQIATQYNIPYWSKDTAYLCRNKIEMKNLMKKNEIKTPNFFKYKFDYSFNYLKESFGLPFVIKPIDGSGSYGFYKINSLSDYVDFLKSSDKNLEYDTEQFINGVLYHVETVKHNDILLFTIAEYISPNAESKNGKLQGSREVLVNESIYDSLSIFNKKVINAFNNNGCFHHEVFVTENKELYFLEIGWRHAGPPCHKIFLQHYGYHQQILYIMLNLGFDSNNIREFEKTSNYQCEFYVPLMKGIYKGISLPCLKADDVEINNLVEVGVSVPHNAESYSDSCATIQLTYKQLDFDNIKQDFYCLKNSNIFL